MDNGIEFDVIECETKIQKEGKPYQALNFFLEILAYKQEGKESYYLVRILTKSNPEPIVKVVQDKSFANLKSFEDAFCCDLISQISHKNDYNKLKEKLFFNFKKKKSIGFEILTQKFGRYHKNGLDLVLLHNKIFDRTTRKYIQSNHDKTAYLFENEEGSF